MLPFSEKTKCQGLGLLALFLFLLPGQLFAEVITYPGPEGITPAPDVTITADGKPVFVYETHVNFGRVYQNPAIELTPIAYFDFNGTATVVVKRNTPFTNAVIRPLSLGIKPVMSGSALTFTLSRPAKVTIEFDGELHRALHLFADSIEANPPHEGDAGVRYFGPGVHDIGEFQIADDQTVYIAGGAFVNGQLIANRKRGVVIKGRGILNGSTYPRNKGGSHSNIELNYCANPTVDGIICLDPPGWGFNLHKSTNLVFKDVKYISSRGNGDGPSLQSCQNATVADCFLRAWDDALVIKNYDGDTEKIEVRDCIVWSDLAQCFEIGYETRGDTLKDVYIHDCTVIHAMHLPVISIHDGDRARISKIRYENIMVEDAEIVKPPSYNPYIIDLWTGTAQWTRDRERGSIDGVYIKNVSVLAGVFGGNRIAGFDTNHLVQNVTIENFKVRGKLILDPKDPDANFTINPYTRNIKFIGPTPVSVEKSAPST